MLAPIERIMQTYGMIVRLTPDQEKVARERVMNFLSQNLEQDEHKQAIAGLQYVRALKL